MQEGTCENSEEKNTILRPTAINTQVLAVDSFFPMPNRNFFRVKDT